MRERALKKIIPFEQKPDFFFRAGLRHAYRRRFATSLRYLKKAVEKDPYNAEYQFNLACVLSELKENKKSNEILIRIIKDIDPTLTECYFGVGCNYLEMGNFKKAREYFERYVNYNREGYFVNETYDILYYLQVYDDASTEAKRDRTATRLELQSIELLRKGMYGKARLKLEKLIEINPYDLLPRNNLAIACFFNGEIDRAISLAKSVLKLDDNNPFALCNLALFYANAGKIDLYKKSLGILSKIKISRPEEFLLDSEQFLRAVRDDRTTENSLKEGIVEVIRKQKGRIKKRGKK